MKKLILLSVYASFALSATFINPLPVSSKATENGGVLQAIDAYQDGVGAMVVTQGRGVDNSAMNTLVFKYGASAKSNTLSLPDQVILTGSAEDKLLAGTFYSDGTSCSIANKTGSTYLNGTCQGGTWTNNGTACDDLNSATTGETWLNGVCQGGVLGNVAGNGLIYDNCEGGARNWTDAGSYCSSKGSGWRLPTLAETSYASGVNGVPQCSATTWSWTSTPYGIGGYYVWSASSYNAYLINSTLGVRCVK